MTKALQSMYQEADKRDAYLVGIYAKAQLTRRGWLMILSGLAAFDRNAGKDHRA